MTNEIRAGATLVAAPGDDEPDVTDGTEAEASENDAEDGDEDDDDDDEEDDEEEEAAGDDGPADR